MTMDQIKEVLTTLAQNEEYPFSGGVYYGVCNAATLPEWNYFVFNRKEEKPTNNKSFTSYYEVHIIHEDYIPEDYPLTVVEALKDVIPGFSLSENITYDYTEKGSTDVVVEICNLTFKKARKV